MAHRVTLFMRSPRSIFPIALACSVGLHLAATAVYVEIWRWGWSVTRPAAPEIVVKLDDSPDLQEIGAPVGSGTGSLPSAGEKPLEARQADQDQPALDRNPVGAGRVAALMSPSDGPPGNGSGSASAAANSAPPIPQTSVNSNLIPAMSPVLAVRLPRVDALANAGSLPVPEVKAAMPDIKPDPEVVQMPTTNRPQPQAPPINVQPAEVAAANPPQTPGDGRQGGAAHPAGQPLPHSDADSDPFLRHTVTAVYRNGRLDVQPGRKVVPVRPDIEIAGELDIEALNFPTVVLEVHIDARGKVTDVEYSRRSGSVAIDEPTRRAMYDWYFEPAKDKSGHPIPDVILFTMEYR